MLINYELKNYLHLTGYIRREYTYKLRNLTLNVMLWRIIYILRTIYKGNLILGKIREFNIFFFFFFTRITYSNIYKDLNPSLGEGYNVAEADLEEMTSFGCLVIGRVFFQVGRPLSGREGLPHRRCLVGCELF